MDTKEKLALASVIIGAIIVTVALLNFWGVSPLTPAKPDIKILSPRNGTLIDWPQDFSGSYSSTDKALNGYLLNSRQNESAADWHLHSITLGLDGTWKTTRPVSAGDCENPGFQEIYAILTKQTFEPGYSTEHKDMEWLRKAEADAYFVVERTVECPAN